MKKLRRSMTMYCLFRRCCSSRAHSGRRPARPIVEQLAKTYGLDSWGQIDAIRYTFNLDLAALNVNLSRTWTWEPKTGNVTYETTNKDGKPVKVLITVLSSAVHLPM